MPAQVLIISNPDGTYRWLCLGPLPSLLGDDPAQLGVQGRLFDGTLDTLREQRGAERYELCLLLAGQQVGTRLVPVPAKEKRHLREAVPYQLEETLVGDIERLHFAFGACRLAPRADGGNDALVPTAWCDRQWLRDQLSPFAEAGLALDRVLPGPLMLPRPRGWALHLEDGLCCHLDDGDGFATDASTVPEALAMALRERAAPEALYLSAPTSQALAQLQAALPAELAGVARVRCASLWSLMAGDEPAGPLAETAFELNLLQGAFTPRLPWGRWWRRTRALAALLMVALGAWTVDGVVQIQQQQRQQQLLHERIEQAFRAVVPQGVLVDAQKQLRHRLASLGGDTHSPGPLALLARIAPLLAEGDGLALGGLSYNLNQAELRFNCRAPTFGGIEQLRGRLLAEGLDARLVHSSADGDGQQARFRIRWGAT